MSFVAFRLGFPAVAFWHSCHLLCQNTSGRSAFIQTFADVVLPFALGFRVAFWHLWKLLCRNASGRSAFIQAFADVVLPFPSGFRVAV